MKITVASISLLALAVASTACTTGSSSTEATEPTAGEEPATPVAAEPVAPPEPPAAPVIEGRGKAVLHTSVGPITITFFPEQAPQTVKHIAGLMRAGCYDGVDVFRLEPGFVAQVASVSNHECHPDAMSTVADEPTPLKHDRLHLSLARGQEANSGTSSFSMMLGPGPHMDNMFAIFGRIVDGEDTLKKIEAMSSTKGEQGMRILDQKVTIERVEFVEPVEPEPVEGGPGSEPGV